MNRRTARGLACLLLLTITALCLLPTGVKHALHTQGSLHPWLHLIAFASLSFLCVRALPAPGFRLFILLAMVAFGWGTEFAESLRDGWPVETRDVLTDTAAVLLGWLAASLFPTHD